MRKTDSFALRIISIGEDGYRTRKGPCDDLGTGKQVHVVKSIFGNIWAWLLSWGSNPMHLDHRDTLLPTKQSRSPRTGSTWPLINILVWYACFYNLHSWVNSYSFLCFLLKYCYPLSFFPLLFFSSCIIWHFSHLLFDFLRNMQEAKRPIGKNNKTR